MKRSEPVELMNLCMIRRGSKVLVQDRTDPNWPGVAFPGGHVEKGESFTDAVIREVQRDRSDDLLSAPVRDQGLVRRRRASCRAALSRGAVYRNAALFRRGRGLVGGARRSPSLDLASSDMLDLLRVFEEDDLSELFYRQNGEDWTYELK